LNRIYKVGYITFSLIIFFRTSHSTVVKILMKRLNLKMNIYIINLYFVMLV